MDDLITLVILASFSGVVVLVVLGFFLVRQRSGRSRFESQDYYKSYQRQDRFSQGSPFRQREQNPRVKAEQQAILLVVVALVATSIALAIYDPIEGLLLLFLLPIVVRVVRSRYETRRAPHDENQSY
jgi:Flp pilus assembly protein TadB